MEKFKYILLSIIAFILKCESANIATISPYIIIKNVDRTIDLSTQNTKIISKVTLENKDNTPAKSFLIAFEPDFKGKVSFISPKDSSGKDLKHFETSVKGRNEKFYQVNLKEPLNSGLTTDISLEYVIIHALQPYPQAISQQEDQLVKYKCNLYFFSPYHVESQKTTVTKVKSVESFTKVKPVNQQDDSIIYGPFNNVIPFSQENLSIHYKNNSPFLTVKKIVRVIEVSHWGNIAVEEEIEVLHMGAKLKGSFSRYEYQHDHHSGPSSVRSYKTLLPASASDVYYRDTNGNISTSNMKMKKDAVELDLRPRYPLFGGWKTHYLLGYNVPSYEYLYNQGNDFLLKMRAVDHIFDDMQVEELVTKIILPEGSTNIKLHTPYPVSMLPNSLHYTYLDTKGRPVISFMKKNVVENHIQDFQLRYTFPRVLMFQEPLLVVGFLYLLFLCVIIFVRIDFSIHKSELHKE